MGKYSIKEFIDQTSQKNKGQGKFELESDKMLEINLDGKVWMKIGSMISYRGNVKFEREGISDRGWGKTLKKKFTGEGTTLMKAEGQGDVYLADYGKKISVIDLDGEILYVNGNDILAFEDSMDYDITMMRRVAGMMAGGLFNLKMEGDGYVAITTHGDPLTLRVTPEMPVYTDPNATVAWSGGLEPQLKTDISFKTFIGKGSGETAQMYFEGEGFVVVQPFEEIYYAG